MGGGIDHHLTSRRGRRSRWSSVPRVHRELEGGGLEIIVRKNVSPRWPRTH